MDLADAVIAAALGKGLKWVASTLAEKGLEKAVERGVVVPGLDRLNEWLKRRGYLTGKADRALQDAVRAAMIDAGAPEEESDRERYIRVAGLDQLNAMDNTVLRREIARSVMLMNTPDCDLIPASLLSRLRWPSSRRQQLADYLAALRRRLAATEEWRDLVAYTDREDVREQLREMGGDLARTAVATERTADGVERIEAYLKALAADRGLDLGKTDAAYLKKYVDHIVETHSRISFLFVRPAGRPGQVATEAELETVFVPLQVHDPRAEEELRRRGGGLRPDEMEPEEKRAAPVGIKEVLAEYPVFLLKGSPGCGKTTLLRHLALCFARGQAAERLGWSGQPLLPILVPLRNFGHFLKERRSGATGPGAGVLRKFIETYFAGHELDLPRDFFLKRLDEGGCLVLLDGLDEVADRDLRATVAQMVNAFIQHYARRENRFGLASRPKGYEEVADYLPRLVVCTVRPLTPDGRDDLVGKLLEVLEPNALLRRDQTRELIADMRAKEKVADLARNPLFCTTLVLVYKYRGTTLPERRVDVYHELVDLMLGFWETHKAQREHTAEVRELVLMDGTGRSFMDERDAVEAKRRALTDMADWMQRKGLAQVPQVRAAAHLAGFFRRREGATRAEDRVWAWNFLSVAHQRSGLFIEAEPETYAFSHQNFREYLAATALIGRVDEKMVCAVLDHAEDPWWEEVILLAAAHPNLSDARRELLLQRLRQAGHLVLAGRCAVDAGARLPAPLRDDIRADLYAHMTYANLEPTERYDAAEVLDELDWLPDDLNAWLPCPGTAQGGGDLLAMKYPVTNAQFERFVEAEGYENRKGWGGKRGKGWQWRLTEHPSYRGEDPVTEPESWHYPRFGKERHGYPVVGVSWYEAVAYAAWLAEVLERARAGDETLPEEDQALVAHLVAAGAKEVRLPQEKEWEAMAGGVEDEERYPWDAPGGPATKKEAAILARANTDESGIGGTSSVGMYPLGASKPFGLMDLAGNVWEWTDSWYDENRDFRVLRGGAWYDDLQDARCGYRHWLYPLTSYYLIGFRLVSPIGSDS